MLQIKLYHKLLCRKNYAFTSGYLIILAAICEAFIAQGRLIFQSSIKCSISNLHIVRDFAQLNFTFLGHKTNYFKFILGKWHVVTGCSKTLSCVKDGRVLLYLLGSLKPLQPTVDLILWSDTLNCLKVRGFYLVLQIGFSNRRFCKLNLFHIVAFKTGNNQW